MHIEVDIKCMETNFGGRGCSGFGDIACFFSFKTAKFPFRTMDYSPWSSKNLIDWNRTKKFLQIRIDELCMCTNFGVCDLFGFGDTVTFKNGQISFSDHGL